MKTKNWLRLLSVIVLLTGFIGCSSQRLVSVKNPESQASVRINLNDGSFREGIIVTADSLNLIYIDAKTHDKNSIKLNNIKTIVKLDRYFDFEANPIPQDELNQYKSPKNTLLYGSAGLFLGAAVGTGVGIVLYAQDQPLLANASILLFGGLGAYYFGQKGHDKDLDEAAFAARKARYEKFKAIQAEKRKLEELKKQKEQLLKKLKQQKKETK